MLSKQNRKLAYLTSQYPRFSTTFIDREIETLRAQNIEVKAFSVRRSPRASYSDGKQETIKLETSVLLSARGCWDALSTIIKNFRPALRILNEALRTERIPKALVYSIEALALARSLEQSGITHIHVHIANQSATVARLACKLRPTFSYSITLHGPEEFIEMLARGIPLKLSGAKFIRVISNFGQCKLNEVLDHSARQKVSVIRSGVDLKKFSFVDELRQPQQLRLLFVGRLSPEKNPLLLVHLCEALRKKNIEFHLTFVGDGPLSVPCYNLAQKLDLLKNISFHGRCDEGQVAHELEQASVLLLPSQAEGIPTVIMEAMAKGTLVIAMASMGVPELVTDEVTGWLFHNASVDAILECLEKFRRQEPDKLRLMRLRARQKIEDEFSLPDSAQSLVRLLKDAIDPVCRHSIDT